MKFDLSLYNKRQKEAITHDLGPLLVISGAGTGKTHVLTGRILYLILEKGVSPDSILALTFTEKATQEMTQRIDEALPIGYPNMWIKTYHGFCENMLRERGHEIGISPDYKLLDEVNLWMYLKRHVLDFKLEYYRSLGNPQKFLRIMQEHFSRLQDENISAEEYIAFAKELQKNAESDEDNENAAKELELAGAFEIYQNLLAKNDLMDFGGLMANTLRLFETRKSVLKETEERFQYILVDEFQDTNYAQNKIVMMLAQEHKNLFVVGDDDQSIYKWRGASLTNIQYFQKNFPDFGKIVLNENYRNSQAILDCAYKSIQNNNPSRLEVTEKIDKKLIAVSKRKERIPEVHHFSSINDEVDFVVSKAVYSLSKGQNTAILVRTNALGVPFLNKLKETKLPYQHFSDAAIFTKPAIKDLMALLRVIADPMDDLSLFRFLSLPYLNVKMDELLMAVKKAKLSNNPLIIKISAENQFEKIYAFIAELIEFSRNHSVSETIGKYLKQSEYLRYLEKNNSAGLTDIASFSEKIIEFEKKNEFKSVTDFLTYANLSEEVGYRERAEPNLDSSSIKILTIHSAKGLEFDTVFVPGLTQHKFPTISRKDPFEIPKELIKESLPDDDHHTEEERRLFYVAITRARENLYLSYSDFYDGKKKWKVSQFISEILEHGKASLKNHAEVTKNSNSGQGELPIIVSRKHRTIKLQIPKLSYSQLDTFKTCPLKYQYRYLFNLPSPLPAVVNFGSSIHGALKDFYLYLQNNPQKINDDLLPIIKKFYDKNWIPYGYETRELQNDQKKRGYTIIENFYKHEMKDPGIPEFIEKQFIIHINDIVLSGRIDRIDRLADGTYEVIDYKTGSTKEENLKNDLQLSIYALACKEVLNIPVSRLSLYYVETLTKNSTVRSEKQIEECKLQIIEYANEIASSDFTPTPGFHCSYCDYKAVCPVALVTAK